MRVLQIRPDLIFGHDWTRNDFGTDVLGVLGLISHSLLSKLSLLSISEDLLHVHRLFSIVMLLQFQ